MLILRSRMSGGAVLCRTFVQALMPPADFLDARLMVLTIKRNVERTMWGESAVCHRAEQAT